MAQAPREFLLTLRQGFSQLSNTRKFALLVGLPALVTIVVAVALFASTPGYKVLFSNVSEKDGGAIIAQLSQMNVPYRLSGGGSVIEVPSDVVYKTRLQLASQGLPKGGGVGFDLLERQRFGTSQFVEQVNYQRGLEGELAQTIRALREVQDARVHLAIPRPSVFVRENQKPSASVMIALHPGRGLDQGQVSGIVHLVASSVPELSPRQVTVVDQSGKLLSGAADDLSTSGLDRSQIKYLHQIEDDIARKIEAILRPLTGPDNVRAQVAAALDFSQVEQTSETYRPNNDPRDQAMRSQQTTEATSQTPQGPQGVPGALSNTPPGAASAPLVQPPQGEAGGAAAGPTTASTSQRDSKVNYELDKTVRHTRTEVGTIKRLSVAVVVNHKRVVDKTGEAKLQPYDPKEMAQIQTLVREAMGFDKDRGDTVNVVNAPFLVPFEPEVVPFWKDPGNLPLAIEAGKWLLVAGLGLATLLMVRSSVRDLIRLSEVAATPPPAPEPPPAVEEPPPSPEELRETLDYERSIQRARDIARENPRLAAQVIRGWVTKGE
jgi:flagellar M-ring protein FliF